jgi:hypothetical protein
MKKEHKFKFGKTVYFMNNNAVKKGFIFEIETTETSVWGMQIHNDPDNKRLQYFHRYKICTDAYTKRGSEWISESDIFLTKKELLATL